MRKLFYLLLALPLAFAACTEKPAPEPAPEPQPDPQPDPQPEYVMDMAFAAAARIPSADLDLKDTDYQLCFVDDAELYEFSLLLSGEDAVLTAGKYESEKAGLSNTETEAFVEFAEGNVTVGLEGDIYSFEMVLADAEGALYRFTYEGTVLDMEPAEKPEPQVFNPVKVEAYRAQDWELGNFELDLYIDETNYHSLDMQDLVNPNDKYLSEGNYTIANGGVTSWSNFLWNIETGEGAYVVDAEIALSHNDDGTSTIVGFIESEYGDHLNINWTGVIDGFTFGGETPEPAEDIVFNAPYFAGEYYTPSQVGAGKDTHNYYFILSDVVVDGDYAVEGATYFYFDLYNTEFNETITIPNGVYTLDPTDSCDNLTAGAYYTYGFYVQNADTIIWYIPTSGTVTVSDNKIVAEFVLEDGRKATVTYEGDLSFGNGGGSAGGDTGIEGDVDVNISGAGIHAEYYMDYYGVGSDNWWITVYEDDASKSGVYFQFDILSSVSADDWRGSYLSLNEATAYDYSFFPGEVSGGYLAGSWYAILDNDSLTDTAAALVGGTVEFVFNEDGSKTVVLDCVDADGNKITGTVQCNPSAEAYSAGGAKNLIPVKRTFVIR
jgi:hypothetical protein